MRNAHGAGSSAARTAQLRSAHRVTRGIEDEDTAGGPARRGVDVARVRAGRGPAARDHAGLSSVHAQRVNERRTGRGGARKGRFCIADVHERRPWAGVLRNRRSFTEDVHRRRAPAVAAPAGRSFTQRRHERAGSDRECGRPLAKPAGQAKRRSPARAAAPNTTVSANRCASAWPMPGEAPLTAASIACSAGLKGNAAEITRMTS